MGVVPPLLIEDVNTAAVPAHKVVCVVATVIVGATDELTVSVSVLEVTLADDTQPALEVSTQLIWSLLAGAARVYVGEVAPVMFIPFFFHW